jgi:CRP-like cAMP-binding protein
MKTFLKLLSPSLRSSILDSCSNIELRFIVNFMKTVIFLPQDEICRQGDKGTKIYFISRGKVEVYIGPDDVEGEEYQLKRLNSNNSKKSLKSMN